ncbi:transmembrane protein 198 isoform X1 [Ictidomys tridecemlineatus]
MPERETPGAESPISPWRGWCVPGDVRSSPPLLGWCALSDVRSRGPELSISTKGRGRAQGMGPRLWGSPSPYSCSFLCPGVRPESLNAAGLECQPVLEVERRRRRAETGVSGPAAPFPARRTFPRPQSVGSSGTPQPRPLRPLHSLFRSEAQVASSPGYRCFKAVLFLTGLLFGSVVIFLLCYRERVLETQLSAGASAGIALGIGLLCGLVAMLVRSVGLFLVGLLLGLLLAAAALLGSAPYYQPGSVWGPLGLLLGGGLLCALLTLRWPRPLTTLATAVTGAALIATAADYFAELLLLGRYVVERLRAAPVPPLCWRSWALLALWPLLSLMGVLVQWRVTAEGDSHTEVVISRQRRRVQLMRIRQQEERKEKRRKKRPPRAPPRGPRAPPRPGPPDPAYRRRPVPIKRFNGDVLSPSYIQSFRDRQTGSSLSSFMASPTDADYEYGSRGPLTACSGPPVRV